MIEAAGCKGKVRFHGQGGKGMDGEKPTKENAMGTMAEKYEIKPIGRIITDFDSKFGIPRQSSLVKGLKGKIIFYPEYRDPVALRGLENYSYIWLVWSFSDVRNYQWTPSVRPPRLGGNKKIGVFASRSPFRPNGIGLSSVKIEGIDLLDKAGPIIYVSGVDLLNNTPIFDIKPYIKTDIHTEGSFGLSDIYGDFRMEVDCPPGILDKLPEDQRENLLGILSLNPIPSYQKEPDRIYGLAYAGFEVKFKVEADRISLLSLEPAEKK